MFWDEQEVVVSYVIFLGSSLFQVSQHPIFSLKRPNQGSSDYLMLRKNSPVGGNPKNIPVLRKIKYFGKS